MVFGVLVLRRKFVRPVPEVPLGDWSDPVELLEFLNDVEIKLMLIQLNEVIIRSLCVVLIVLISLLNLI